MLTATRRFLAGYPQHRGTLGFLITSDEEAAAIHGTREVMATLQQRGTKITWCLVGEPSSQDTLGDVVRSGRRGSLNGHLTVKGIQGHVAYPTEALNLECVRVVAGTAISSGDAAKTLLSVESFSVGASLLAMDAVRG